MYQPLGIFRSLCCVNSVGHSKNQFKEWNRYGKEQHRIDSDFPSSGVSNVCQTASFKEIVSC